MNDTSKVFNLSNKYTTQKKIIIKASIEAGKESKLKFPPRL